MMIRKETIQDYKAVYELVKEAFATAEHSDGNEQDLVVQLRKGDAFIPELSLIAEENGVIAGHALFTLANVGERKVLVLAPLSVLPAYQRRGIGQALVHAGHEIAKAAGYEYVMVLGSDKYYPRMGYVQAGELGVHTPEDIPREYFMGIKLVENAAPLDGELIYAREFYALG